MARRQGTEGLDRRGGRWGPEHGFPVINLGQPVPSVIVEAYRRLVDPVEGMRGELVGPRVLLTVEVDVDQLLDLRDPTHLAAVGLDDDALRGPWPPCVRVARAAHQLGLHGILAPAATELGITLALFEQHLPTIRLQLSPAGRRGRTFLLTRVPRFSARPRSRAAIEVRTAGREEDAHGANDDPSSRPETASRLRAVLPAARQSGARRKPIPALTPRAQSRALLNNSRHLTEKTATSALNSS